MTGLHFGQVVLILYPFTDGTASKRRPALVIRDTEDGDLIVCRVTSKLYRTQYDVPMIEWEKSGLRLPSVIRTHKVATLASIMVERILGEIPESLKSDVSTKLADIIAR